MPAALPNLAIGAAHAAATARSPPAAGSAARWQWSPARPKFCHRGVDI